MLMQVVVWPMADFGVKLWFWGRQKFDQCLCCESENRLEHTKRRHIHDYIDLYLGPEYIVNYRLSWLIAVTYVTMMYGIGLPLLFPIAFLSFLVIYVTERYHLAYTFKAPPAISGEVTKQALRLLSFTPFVFLANGFWMLSNRQMFENIVD